MARSEQGSVTAVTGGRGARADGQHVPSTRVIQRRPGLPGSRAVVGALLMATAAVGVFLAYTDANKPPADTLVVAAHAIRVGEVIAADDLAVVRAEVPEDTRRTAFSSPEQVIGRVALGPIGAGELVQAASLTDEQASPPGHEVAITLPRDQLAVGRLKQGERVDVFVTYDERTTSVVRGAEVVQILTPSDGSLTSDREIGIVVSVPSGEAVAALVHALRTGDVTVVRATLATESSEPLVFEPSGGDGGR